MSKVEESAGKATAKKVPGCAFWMPAITTAFGPRPLIHGERQDSPYKAKKEAERIILAALSEDPR